MSPNGYQIAFEEATNERREIQVKIQQLRTRDALIEKLLDSLAPLIQQNKLAEERIAGAAVPAVDARGAEAAPAASSSSPARAAMRRDFGLSHGASSAIKQRAFELYEARGRNHGRDLQDWFRAEEEVLGRRSDEGSTGEDLVEGGRIEFGIFNLQAYHLAKTARCRN